MDKEYLQKRINYCKAMAKVCEKRQEFYLQQFYINAQTGYMLKLNQLEHGGC